MAFGPPHARPKKPKRYGWHRRYNDDDLNPKWRLVSTRAGARLTDVLCIKGHLQDCAAKTRKAGRIDSFDIHVCAAGLDIEPETVANVVRVLVDMQWLSREHVIVSWLDDQPELEDPTAADRQRLKRRRAEARTRAGIGMASEDDLELLSKPEREALARLAAASRVTAPQPPQPETTRAFIPIRAKEESHAALEIAAEETQRLARAWLLGDGTTLSSYGPASKIVAENFRQTRMSADGMVRNWLKELAGDATMLASIISGAAEQSLNGDAFRAVIEQRLESVIREQTAGPSLPFGFAAQNGGKR